MAELSTEELASIERLLKAIRDTIEAAKARAAAEAATQREQGYPSARLTRQR